MTQPAPARPAGLRLGLRANLAQFSLLVGVNALVGGMVGQERSLLSLLATQVFGLAAVSAALTYIVAFGLTKAATNFLAGTLADRYGRKPVLVAGWLVGLPVPLLIIWAPTWSWIVAANVLLGVNQGLCWSTTVIMKIDLAGPKRRGLAMGLNEAAGYLAVALTAYLTGLIAARAGLRPEPFYLGLAYAGLGLGLSALLVRETRGHAQLEAQLTDAGRAADANPGPNRTPAAAGRERLSTREVVVRTSLREPALSACSQAGLVNNLNDGLAWGLLPLLFVRGGLPVGQVGLLAALYPAVWGLGQLITGPLSDRLGRKPLITGGMLVQAVALAGTALAGSFLPWAASAILLGIGTAMVYPTLLAAISDVAHPSWRATAVGVYRLWRDAGFAVGALLAGLVADLAGLEAAVWVVAALTAASGLVVAVRMYETHPSAARAMTTAQGDRLLRFATFLAPNMLPVYRFLADRIGDRLGRPVELVVGSLLRPVRTRRGRPRRHLRAAVCVASRPPPSAGRTAGRPGPGRRPLRRPSRLLLRCDRPPATARSAAWRSCGAARGPTTSPPPTPATPSPSTAWSAWAPDPASSPGWSRPASTSRPSASSTPAPSTRPRSTPRSSPSSSATTRSWPTASVWSATSARRPFSR